MAATARADRGALLAISVDGLARDNVAGHAEAPSSRAILERLVLRVVNHGEGLVRSFDAFYNALKVTINYRGVHGRIRYAEAEPVNVCVCMYM